MCTLSTSPACNSDREDRKAYEPWSIRFVTFLAILSRPAVAVSTNSATLPPFAQRGWSRKPLSVVDRIRISRDRARWPRADRPRRKFSPKFDEWVTVERFYMHFCEILRIDRITRGSIKRCLLLAVKCTCIYPRSRADCEWWTARERTNEIY